jgi:hypothetical protein
MTFSLLNLEADSEMSSGISEGHLPEVLGPDSDQHWVLFIKEHMHLRKEADRRILLRLWVGPGETSTVTDYTRVGDKILVWYANSLGRSRSEALSFYTTACRLLAKTMQENLFEVSASWANMEIFLGREPASIAHAFCGAEYLQSIQHQEIASKLASKEIFDFLSKKTHETSPAEILYKISMLARKSFPELVSHSFQIVEDPELPQEERICLELHSRGTIEEVSLQYDNFINSLISKFRFHVRRWLVVDINLI